jgi:hypothetical protein
MRPRRREYAAIVIVIVVVVVLVAIGQIFQGGHISKILPIATP